VNKYKIRLLCLLLTVAITNSFAQNYSIDKNASEIKIYVFKNGILSGLAHNHVIVIKEITSKINWNKEDFTKSIVQLEIPIKKFIVDDSTYRNIEGKDFKKEVSEEDRIEIYNTMLDEDHLYAEKYPEIFIMINGFSGKLPNPDANLEITLHEVTKKFDLPINLQIGNGDIQANGELKILQTDFNINPHSTAFGMIGIEDELTIKFYIKAYSN
jgi:polyisoprenoid-binding protein YceI